ncbi:MAG: T9SS type A sorting domain-containing protein [candidate division WOR-3 bacterium]
MRKHHMLTILFVYSIAFALSYVESSVGLNVPQMETGRTEIEMVDINNDGNIDILSIGDHGSPYVNTQEHGVMVWFGNGQGIWSVYQNGDFGYGGIAIGDVNNDGFLDIGYGMHHNESNNDFGDSILEVALGDGTGQNWIPWDDGISIGDTIFPVNWGMFCTDFADIDNDGDLDLGANSFGGNDGVHIFVNHLDGTWHQCFGFLGGNSTNDFLFGDVNNDGYVDFCAAHQYGSIYLNNGAGGFILADGNLPPGGSNGRPGPSLGDVDNDGDLDFAFCNTNGGVEVWRWQGNNTWSQFSGNLPTAGRYRLTQLCDMNIDGFIDLCAFGDSIITIWLGDGQGNWIHDTTFYIPGPGTVSAFRVGADADHNGYPDIALVGRSGSVNCPRFYKESSVSQNLFIFPVFPRGGEKFYRNSVQFIKWTCGVPVGIATIKLELSTTGPNGPWTLIASNLKNNCRYQWRIPSNIQGSNNCYIKFTAATSNDTAVALTPRPFSILPVVGFEERPRKEKSRIALSIYPNPSNKGIAISFNTDRGITSLKVFDNTGRLVKDLFRVIGAGRFNIYWNGDDQNGKKVPPGLYILRMEYPEGSIEEKIVIME